MCVFKFRSSGCADHTFVMQRTFPMVLLKDCMYHAVPHHLVEKRYDRFVTILDGMNSTCTSFRALILHHNVTACKNILFSSSSPQTK